MFAALRYKLLKCLLQRFECVLREDGMLVAEEIVGMNLGAEHKLDAREIARAEIKLLVELAAGLDQQGGLASFELGDRVAEELGFRLGDVERLDHRQLTIGNLGGNRRTERAHQLLLREGVLVAARLGSVDRTARTPKRASDRRDARAARSLLLPQLTAGARDKPAGLGRRGALSKCGAVMLDRLPQEAVIDLAGEHFVEEFELPDFLSAEIDYVDVCHRSSLFVPAIDAAGLDFVRLRCSICSPRSVCFCPSLT